MIHFFDVSFVNPEQKETSALIVRVADHSDYFVRNPSLHRADGEGNTEASELKTAEEMWDQDE